MIYEYLCEKCGIFEVKQSIKDLPLKECPKCGSFNFIRAISGGQGFIVHGYNANNGYSQKDKKSPLQETQNDI